MSEQPTRRDDAIAELKRALAATQPPVIDGKGRPNQRDRTGCMCVLSPRTVAWLLVELDHGAGVTELAKAPQATD